MSIIVTQFTRKLLAQSIEQVSEHQDAIAQAMAQHLASDLVGSVRDRPQRSASMLVDLLISQAHWLAETGECLGLGYEHAMLVEQKVGTREFTPFGDKLAQVLPSLVPAYRAHAVTSAWCDAYWGIILSMPRSSPESSSHVSRPVSATAEVGVGPSRVRCCC